MMVKISAFQLYVTAWFSLLISFFTFWGIPFISWCSLLISVLTHMILYFNSLLITSFNTAIKNDGDVKGCTILWEIENLSKCCLKKGKFIKSPTFTVDSLDGTKWSLNLYPKGMENSNLATVFLKREKDQYLPNVIQVKYQIAILGKDGAILEDFSTFEKSFERENSAFFTVFEKRDKASGSESEPCLPEDTVTIQCKIWKKNELPIVSEILSARTVLKNHQRSFFWRIHKYSSLRPGKLRVLKKWIDDVINFRLIFSEGIESEKKLFIDIISSDTSIYAFSFKASIMDSEGNKINCGNHECFDGDLQKGISFPLSFTHNTLMNMRSLYLPKDVLSLDCEYVFSTLTSSYECERCGTHSSPELMEATKSKKKLNVEKDMPKLSSVLMNDLKFMYSEAILCDVELRTSTQAFSAHMAILSARSTVFRRMFSNDMKERNTGHVDVTDMEDETVERMLRYIYTDSLGNLKLEDASKLYMAADKYDISSLKLRCSTFLKENMCPVTACDVLSLADMHQDNDLKSAVQNYILEHDKEVFDTLEWKHFMATNLPLAADVMYQKISQAREEHMNTQEGEPKHQEFRGIELIF